MFKTLILNRKSRKTKAVQSTKWTPTQFLIWGFNLIVGFGFVVGLNKSFSPVGNFFPIVIIICAFISFVTGYSFGRLSCHYFSNGGAYLYCKQLFGKKVTYFSGFFQYIKCPMVAVSAFFGMLWAFYTLHTSASSSNPNLQRVWWVGVLGGFLFLGTYIVMSYGFVATKWTLFILWTLKWAFLIFSIVLAFVLIERFGQNIGHNGTQSVSLKVVPIIGAIITFFFSFGGFETIAVVAEDVEDPQKNMRRTLVLIICLATLFYLFYFYLMLGSLGAGIDSNTGNASFRLGQPTSDWSPSNPGSVPNLNARDGSDFNPVNQLLISALGSKFKGLNIAAGGIVTLVLTLVVVAQLSNKSISRLLNGWVNARMISVMAHDGFLPVELAAKNKYNQFKRTLAIDTFVSVTLIIIFYPIYLSTNYNISDTVDLYTISSFVLYLFVLSAAIKLWKVDKKSNVNIIELFAYILMFFVLLFLLIIYFISGLEQGIESLSQHNETSSSLGVFVTTITYIILLIFAVVLYFYGKKAGWHDRGLGDKEDVDYAKHHDLVDVEPEPNF